MIPFATTTVTVLRAPEQTDAYPDVEPVYAPVGLPVRANLEIMPRRLATEEFERSTAVARFMCDPTDVQAFDYLRDEATGGLWRVEWAEARPGMLAHVTGQLLDVSTELEASRPRLLLVATASGHSDSSGAAVPA